MRQATWISAQLRHYSTTVYCCHFCGAQFITDTFFALHLVEYHAVRDLAIVRFVRGDSEGVAEVKANRSTSRRQRRSA